MTKSLKGVRFGELKKVMFALGYETRPVDKAHVAYVHPGRELFAVVPHLHVRAAVRPLDLLGVQKTLMHEGVNLPSGDSRGRRSSRPLAAN
jgi:hypothetical protein